MEATITGQRSQQEIPWQQKGALRFVVPRLRGPRATPLEGGTTNGVRPREPAYHNSVAMNRHLNKSILFCLSVRLGFDWGRDWQFVAA
jgi:hypothetical protein